MSNSKSPDDSPDRNRVFSILNGTGSPKTTLVLKDAQGTHEFHGPVMSSKTQLDRRGTTQWIAQIFVSPDRDPGKAFEAAVAAAIDVLHTPANDPFQAMGSSLCGLSATLHVIGADQPVKIDVSRMVTDTDHPIGGRPFIVSVSLWTDKANMTTFEIAEFNSIATVACRADHKGDPDPL